MPTEKTVLRVQCPTCGSRVYKHSRWKDRKIVGCSDCPQRAPVVESAGGDDGDSGLLRSPSV